MMTLLKKRILTDTRTIYPKIHSLNNNVLFVVLENFKKYFNIFLYILAEITLKFLTFKS